jgi:isopenicillin-N N-acyltransferase-like protein
MAGHTLPHQIELFGSPRQRGRMHGESLREIIRSALERWETYLLDEIQTDLEAYVDQFLGDTDFLPAIERWTPGLLEEVRGISEGAAMDFRTMLCWNLSFDEHWNHMRDLKLGGLGPPAGCTAIGVFGQADAPTLLAQNNDLPDYLDGTQTLIRMRLPERDLELLIFTPAGALAQNSISSRGLGVCVNTLPQLDYCRDGLPSFFVLRALLERETLEEAARFLHHVKHASGLNYMLGSPEKVLDFECSANQVVQLPPEGGGTHIFHTNHPLISDDRGMFHASKQALPPSSPLADPYPAFSDLRLKALQREFAGRGDDVTSQAISAALSGRDVPVCFTLKSYENIFTFGSTIAELSASPTLHLAPGPPALTPYQRFRFS